jgi:hypothetical protein
VSLRAIDPDVHAVSRARIRVVVLRNGRPYFSKVATTGPAGRVSVRVIARRGGCFTARVTQVTALGFVWDGHAPRSRYCRPRSR